MDDIILFTSTIWLWRKRAREPKAFPLQQREPDLWPLPPVTPSCTCAAEVQTVRGASGVPVVPDVFPSVPGSSPRRWGSPSRGPIKTGLRAQLCLPLVKQSGLWASLAEEVGYMWGACFTATGCRWSPEITTSVTLSKSDQGFAHWVKEQEEGLLETQNSKVFTVSATQNTTE